MFLQQIKIKGYRCFNDEFTASFRKGLNVLVGENACGKSSIIDAIRLILLEDEYGRSGVSETDFHRNISKPSKDRGATHITIRCDFNKLTSEEQVAYLPWLDLNSSEKAILNLAIENKEDARGKFKRKIWGNESESALFEWDLLNRINCIYLPPLRDAEDKLKAFKGSRLARLLKNLRKDSGTDELHPLEKKFSALNKDLLKDESIKEANQFIKENIIKSVGQVFGQDASLQFSEVNFDRIVERIRLLFYPQLPAQNASTDLNMFRELNENSLGYNNILYLATILAEFDGTTSSSTFHKILLIEEPEAHLHPQLQIRLMQFLQEKAKENNIQIIVTTHSPNIACSVDLDSVNIMTVGGSKPTYTAVGECYLPSDSKDFLRRWLDVTKSSLLFAKGVLLVEGIAEALVVHELSKIVLKELTQAHPDRVYHTDLYEYGISIINLNGIYFDHFLKLFKGYKKDRGGSIAKCSGIPIKCAGITDNDPKKEDLPTPATPSIGKNYQLYLCKELATNSTNCRLFSNLKTFEYDLAMEGDNLSIMAKIQLQFVTTNGPVKKRLQEYASPGWVAAHTIDERAIAAGYLLDHIEKGEFAQALAQHLSKNAVFSTPKYIVDAIKWLVD